MKDWEEKHTIKLNFKETPELWFGMSKAGAKPHQDSHCTSTMSFQLSGRKRWRTGPALEVRNVAGVHGSYDGYIDPEKWQPHFEVILEPGDAIIIPSSFIHETKNIDNNNHRNNNRNDICSMSLTHQFSAPPPVRYIREYLPRLMLSPSVLPCSTHTNPENLFYNYGSMGWKNVRSVQFLTSIREIQDIEQASHKLWRFLLLYDASPANQRIELHELREWMELHSILNAKENSQGLFHYFDVNQNQHIDKNEVIEQFTRWLSISEYAKALGRTMGSIRLKRKVYRCNSCGDNDQSDICDGPIRQFEGKLSSQSISIYLNLSQSISIYLNLRTAVIIVLITDFIFFFFFLF